MCSCDQSDHKLNFIMIWPEKPFFWGVVLVQFQYFGTGTGYGLDILHQRGKRAKTKNKEVLGANSYVCRSYRGKLGRGMGLFDLSPPPWIGLITESNTEESKQNCLKVIRYSLSIKKNNFENITYTKHKRNES